MKSMTQGSINSDCSTKKQTLGLECFSLVMCKSDMLRELLVGNGETMVSSHGLANYCQSRYHLEVSSAFYICAM